MNKNHKNIFKENSFPVKNTGLILIITFLIIFYFTNNSLSFNLNEQVSTHTLDNGMEVIMVERDFSPTIHFNLMFDVGGIDEPAGKGGIAHMVEHMAFKGTPSLGSKDPEKEKNLLEDLEKTAGKYFEAKDNDTAEEKLEELKEKFEKSQEKAREQAETNPLQGIFDKHGAQNYNAGTGYDTTYYYLSLPENKLELYARIQADILKNSVFRYFYKEVDVVKEERRQRNEDDPFGYLQEQYLQKAFQYHHYGRSLIGNMDEISNYRMTEARDFWNTYYHPNRAVLVMIGDIDPEKDIEIIEKYFEAVPAGPEEKTAIPPEPIQTSERRTEVTFDAEPQMLIGYHKPTYPEKDAYIMDIISALLGKGRTSRLYQRLVREEQVAVDVSTYNNMPGMREDNQFSIHVKTRHPHTPEEVEEIIYDEIDKLINEPISEKELEKVFNQVRGDFIRQLDSREGLARQLAFYEHFLDGWENLEKYPDIINSITPKEIQNTARYYLQKDNRTVAILKSENSEGKED
ncbi:MAG: M16 family metallopeptidase [Halanaerobiales bacterium]